MYCVSKLVNPSCIAGFDKSDKKQIWETAFANKLGHLMQGVRTRLALGTETMVPIEHINLPAGRTAAYAKIVVDIQPQKGETES